MPDTVTGSGPHLHSSASFREGDPLFGLLRPPTAESLSQSGSVDGQNKGRARAGTLPSSWLPQIQPHNNQQNDAPTASRYANRLQVASHTARSGASSPIAYNDVVNASATDDGGNHRPVVRSNSSIGSSYPSHAHGPSLPQKSGPGPSQLSSELASSNAYGDAQPSASSLAARLRSGSLASGLHQDPFGTDFFSTWTDDPPRRSPHAMLPDRDSQPGRGRGATIANPSSWASAGTGPAPSNFDSIDQDIRTLDYLGLDDYQGSGDLDLSSHAYRMASLAGRDRATTLASITSRPRLDVNSADPAAADYLERDRWAYQTDGPPQQKELAAPPQLPAYGQHGGLANSSLQQRLAVENFGRGNQALGGRARAISVGMLDAPHGSNDAQHGRGDRSLEPSFSSAYSSSAESVSQEDLFAYAVDHGLDPEAFVRAAASAGVTVTASRNNSLAAESSRQHATRLRAGTIAALGGAGARVRTEQELSRMASLGAKAPMSNQTPSYPFIDDVGAYQRGPAPSLAAPPPVTATAAAPAPTHTFSRGTGAPPSTGSQQPTRSLWIGNLGPSTTGQELMQAFASYGAIESLRLLPEKECGFVNFVDIDDAMRARDDVMHRLGGRIRANGTGPNGTVRIGFGKIDAPSDTSHHHGVGGLSASSTGAGAKHRSVSPAQGASVIPGGDRDENLPTRALWIGSIPNTTTPATLLSLFQPYGPIESARVLTHKNCGFINFERVDDAVRARKMLSGRDLLGTEVGAVRIGFAKIPSRGLEDAFAKDPTGESIGEIVPALENLKGAATIPAEYQALSGGLENYRSELVADLLSKQQQRQRQPPQASSVDSQLTRRAGANASGPPVHSAVSVLSLSHTHSASNSGLSASHSIVPSSEKGGVPLPSEMQPRATSTDLQLIMERLSQDETESEIDIALASVQQFASPRTYNPSIPPTNEANNNRRFDTNKLRDLRKAIEQNQYLQGDIDNIAQDYLDSIVELASDYIGNTVVQKFFEKCSEPVKTALLERLAPHLATIGVHKNGTWAAQKIIDTSQLPEQRALIAHHVRPYLPPLLLDQFGNYVVQCLLPYGASAAAGNTSERSSESDFIFDSIVDRCWEIAQGRFGARSVRACLESPHASKLQRKRVAIAIILNAVPLTTSPNGALLLTWLLDASNLPGRYGLLAPRFTPHLTHLCTHKLASQTVLRVANQNLDPEASQKVLDALFDSPNDAVLEEVLTDQVHGSQFLTKLLASPHLQASQRETYAEQVRRMVMEHNLASVPAYRKLIEELGMPFVSGPLASSNGPLMRVAQPQAQSQPPAAPLHGYLDGQYSNGGLAGSAYPPEGLPSMFGNMSLGPQSSHLPPHLLQGNARSPPNPGSINQLNPGRINRHDGGRSPSNGGMQRDHSANYSRQGAVAPNASRGGGGGAGGFGPSWGPMSGHGSSSSMPAPSSMGSREGPAGSYYPGGHSPVLHQAGYAPEMYTSRHDQLSGLYDSTPHGAANYQHGQIPFGYSGQPGQQSHSWYGLDGGAREPHSTRYNG